MERGRLLHLLYSARNESWVSGEDGFKLPDFPWTFRGNQAPPLPPPGIIDEVVHISDWNTAADEYGNGIKKFYFINNCKIKSNFNYEILKNT